jgi:NADPH2:quinone reductase
LHKPSQLSWEVAGSLSVVGMTAYAAVRAVAPQPGETVAVSAAAGGIGSLVVQLLVLRKARVLGIAGPRNADWLCGHGVIPITYGDELAARLREAVPDGIHAFIDLFGPEYVQLAVDLGVAPERINTTFSVQKAEEVGAKTDAGREGRTLEVFAEIADLVSTGTIDFDIAATFPIEPVLSGPLDYVVSLDGSPLSLWRLGVKPAPIVPPSTLWKTMHHQMTGLNNYGVSSGSKLGTGWG